MDVKFRQKTFYFVGIGGIGMSGLAELLLRMGHRVAGSDRQKSEITDYLERRGAQIYEGHRAQNVGDVDFLIRTSAVPMDNPEVRLAQSKGIPVLRRAELLGQFFNRRFGIAVAGTHGKTTTSSMLGHVLVTADWDPTIIVGGRLMNLKTNARLGQGEVSVAEADEYDRSFLTLFPRIAVLTSLEMDHQDIYADMDDLADTFLRFLRQLPFDGVAVINVDDNNIRKLQDKIPASVVTFALNRAADFVARDLNFTAETSSFILWEKGRPLGDFHLNVPGIHNVKNALAVIAVCRELNLPYAKIRDALVQFEGVERRFEMLGQAREIMVVDDYAHHPTEIAATLQSARAGWQRRIIAVFQPHLFSRTAQFYRQFAEALSAADVAVLTDVYPAREEPLPGVSGKMIDELLQTEHYYVEDKNELPDFLAGKAQTGDMVIFIGAGDITDQAKKFLKKLEEN